MSGNLHTLSAVEATRIPGHPDYMLLALSGTDNAHERFVVPRDQLEQLVAALDAELVRLRARDARH